MSFISFLGPESNKYNFFCSIFDWGTGAKLGFCQSRGTKGGSKLTALEWINGHDVALLMAACDDGTIKIWRHSTGMFSKEPVLVSAWHALTDMQSNARTNGEFFFNLIKIIIHFFND